MRIYGSIVLAHLLMLCSEITTYGQLPQAKPLDCSKCCLHSTGAWTGREEVALHAWHVSSNGQTLWAVGYKGLILHSENGGVKWTRKQIQTKQDLTAVFATADGINVWVAALTDYGPDRLTGALYKSSDAGEHWGAVPGMSVPVDHLTGTADGKHLWAMGTYIRAAHHKAVPHDKVAPAPPLRPGTPEDIAKAIIISDQKRLFDRYGHKLYHLVDGTLKSATEFKFSRFRHGIASSDDGVFLSGFDEGGTTVLCSVDGGKTWRKRVQIDTIKLQLNLSRVAMQQLRRLTANGSR